MDRPTPMVLTDAQWRRLAKLAALPDEARAEVQWTLGFGAFDVTVEHRLPRPSDVKLELSSLRRNAEALERGLREDGPLSMALITPPDDGSVEVSPGMRVGPPVRLNGHLKLTEHRHQLSELIQWLKIAEERQQRGQTANKTAAAHAITRRLDEILRKHTSRGLTRNERNDGRKAFLEECLQLAGSKKGNADSMIRAAIEPTRRTTRGKVSPKTIV